MTPQHHSFIRTVLLLGFTLLLGRLLYTGDIYYYLAPRLLLLAYVTVGILSLLTLIGIKQVLTGRADGACDCGETHVYPTSFTRSLLVYALFVLPLIAGFALPNKYLGSAIAEQKGVSIGGSTKNQAVAQLTNAQPESTPQAEAAPKKSNPKPSASDQQIRQMFNDKGFGDFYTDLATSMYKQPVIQLNDQTFLDGLTILDLFLDEFAGRKLETYGFVYRDPDFTSKQFVAARFSISCCTADATVSGVLIQSSNAKKFATDSWVRVKGTLRKIPFKGNDQLVLVAEQILPIQAPKDPYVYYGAVDPTSKSP